MPHDRMQACGDILGDQQECGISFGNFRKVAVKPDRDSLQTTHQQHVAGQQHFTIGGQANFHIAFQDFLRWVQCELGSPGDQHGIQEGSKKTAGDGVGLQCPVLTDDLLSDGGQPFSCVAGAAAGVCTECRRVFFSEQLLRIVHGWQ